MTVTDQVLFAIIEECSKVAQRAAIAARFGLTECEPGQKYNNAERILRQMSDLVTTIDLLGEASEDFADALERDPDDFEVRVAARIKSFHDSMKHAQLRGTVE